MTLGGRYQSLQKINNKTKRRKLDEGRFHHSVHVCVERMLFNQALGSTVGDYVGPVCVYSTAAVLSNMSYIQLY